MQNFITNGKKIKQEKFNKIANLLLNKTILKVNKKKFRICEIEIYLKDKKHNDEYTHCNKDQSKFGKWYFHKTHKNNYKGGTFKGMDLTLGDKTTKRYCGILIRSIYDIKKKELIEGPCKCVDKILALYSKDKIIDFTNSKLLSSVDNNHQFHLVDKDLEREAIYKGERIGLSEKYPKFQKQKLRYLIYKDKIKKGKKSLEQVKGN